MGWWSETVMGGDPAYDWLYEFELVLSENQKYLPVPLVIQDHPHVEFTRELIEQKTGNLSDRVSGIRGRGRSSQYENVGWQVLGCLLLKYGAHIPDTLRDRIIKAAQEDESDNWEDSALRRAYMNDLIEKIKAHKRGVCVELAEEGLLEKAVKFVNEEADKTDIIDRLFSLAAYHGWELDAARLPDLLRRYAEEIH